MHTIETVAVLHVDILYYILHEPREVCVSADSYHSYLHIDGI